VGSQTSVSSAATDSSDAAGPPDSPERRTRGPRRPLLLIYLILGAWILPILTQLTSTDPILLVAVVFGLGGLLRVGSTVLDRLVITVALLIGLAITGGLVFSLWPWGLQPVAVGGVALTLLAIAYVWLDAAPPWRSWPRRVLGSDLALLLAAAAATFIAYGPSFSVRGHSATASTSLTGHRLAYAGITSDQLRHFNLFDTIHRVGGFTFLKQGEAKNLVDPGMLSVYPPGQHYTYALFDIFLRSNVDPGDSTSEMLRYNVYVSLGFGFLVFCVAWGARWVAGPALTGWRRVFLVSAIAAFLSVGAYTAAVWSTWDSQVFGMALLALLTAISLRPPTGARTHIVLTAALFVAMILTYELFAPFVVLEIVISAVVYRKRWLPHWKFALVMAVFAAPAALSEYLAASAGGLNSAALAQSSGFTVPLSKQSLAIIAALCVVGFATRAARRRPSAIAGLAVTVLSGGAVLAFAAYQNQPLSTSYYLQKFILGWTVLALVSVGSVGHLLRRPKLPSHGVAGVALGCCALAAGIVATDSFWYGPIHFKEVNLKMELGRHNTLAQVWLSGEYIYPVNESYVDYLHKNKLLGDDVPTLAMINPVSTNNVSVTLLMGVLNHNVGLLNAQIYALGGIPDITDAGKDGAAWTSDELNSLAKLEQNIATTPVPVRVIVDTEPLRQKLAAWSADHPDKISQLLYLPGLAQS
jgi:hypothetical protein